MYCLVFVPSTHTHTRHDFCGDQHSVCIALHTCFVCARPTGHIFGCLHIQANGRSAGRHSAAALATRSQRNCKCRPVVLCNAAAKFRVPTLAARRGRRWETRLPVALILGASPVGSRACSKVLCHCISLLLVSLSCASFLRVAHNHVDFASRLYRALSDRERKWAAALGAKLSGAL
eukprot:353273-Chlamydomonas_euryale.AAC.21